MVSCSELPWLYVLASLPTSTLLMSPGMTTLRNYLHRQFYSAYLDSEQRLVAAKVIKRFILHAKKTGFVVEHDFIMATYLADR